MPKKRRKWARIHRRRPTPLLVDTWDADEVFPRVYVGSQEAADDVVSLKRKGISHIVSVRESFLAPELMPYGIWLFLCLILPVRRIRDLILRFGSYERSQAYIRSYPSIVYHRIWKDDLPNINIGSCFGAACRFAFSALQTPRHKVLFHCYAGMSRSATMAMALAIYIHARTTPLKPMKSVDELIREFRERRSMIRPNVGFRKQLILWQHEVWTTFVK